MRDSGDKPLLIIVNIVLVIAVAGLIFMMFFYKGESGSSNSNSYTNIRIGTNTPVPTSTPKSTSASVQNTATASSVSTNTPAPTLGPYEYLFIDENLLYDDSIKTMFDAIVNLEESVKLNVDNLDDLNILIDDCLALISNTQYVNVVSSVEAKIFGGNATVTIQYNDREKVDLLEAEKSVTSISNNIFTNNMTQVEIAKTAYDYIVENTEYDEQAYQTWLKNKNNGSYNRAFSPYGSLIEGYAVCQGYALAYNMLLNSTGIETRFVTSDSLNHAWSIVEIDGDWYHCDTTFDDPVPNQETRKLYTYFLKNDTYMNGINKKRIISTNPTCDAENYNYEIYDFRYCTISYSEQYIYNLENNELYRYNIVNDGIDVNSKESICKDVSSWYFATSVYDIIYTQESDGDIYYCDYNGYYQTLLMDMDDTYIIDVVSKRNNYEVTCINELNGQTFDLTVPK